MDSEVLLTCIKIFGDMTDYWIWVCYDKLFVPEFTDKTVLFKIPDLYIIINRAIYVRLYTNTLRITYFSN
jgi:hypothetical protein